MFGWFNKTVDSVEKVGVEIIKKDENLLKSSGAFAKILDPNGKMRREISRRLSQAYVGYLGLIGFLILCMAFDIGNSANIRSAIDILVELFVPLTTMMTLIVSASFGVNAMNSKKGD